MQLSGYRSGFGLATWSVETKNQQNCRPSHHPVNSLRRYSGFSEVSLEKLWAAPATIAYDIAHYNQRYAD